MDTGGGDARDLRALLGGAQYSARDGGTVPAATVTDLADAGALAGARVVGGMVLVRTKSPDDTGAGARLRKWLGVPHDRRWMAAPISSDVGNALECAGVGPLTALAHAR